MAPNLGIWYGSLLLRDEQYRTWLKSGKPYCFWMSGFFNPQGFVTSVQQEITRAHKFENWALDSVVIHAEVTEIDNPDSVRQPPKEGVYVNGLFLDGAAWSHKENSLMESSPKKLYANMPLLLITAVTKAARKNMTNDYGPYGGFDCPVYKYRVRTDRYIIFNALLPSRDRRPLHWILRGVALLCSTS